MAKQDRMSSKATLFMSCCLSKNCNNSTLAHLPTCISKLWFSQSSCRNRSELSNNFSLGCFKLEMAYPSFLSTVVATRAQSSSSSSKAWLSKSLENPLPKKIFEFESTITSFLYCYIFLPTFHFSDPFQPTNNVLSCGQHVVRHSFGDAKNAVDIWSKRLNLSTHIRKVGLWNIIEIVSSTALSAKWQCFTLRKVSLCESAVIYNKNC